MPRGTSRNKAGEQMPWSSESMVNNFGPAAENGLFDRRAFFKGGSVLAAAMTGYTIAKPLQAQTLSDDPWSGSAGTPSGPYEARSRFENDVVRTMTNPNGEPRSQQSRHLLKVLPPLYFQVFYLTSFLPRRLLQVPIFFLGLQLLQQRMVH